MRQDELLRSIPRQIAQITSQKERPSRIRDVEDGIPSNISPFIA